MAKKRMDNLFRDNPETSEGKYLVKRRDGTVPEWPHFVLGARDPMTPWALRAYAIFAFLFGYGWAWPRSVWRLAADMRRYRRDHGDGDPNMGPHRKDDPATVAEMRKGRSA